MNRNVLTSLLILALLSAAACKNAPDQKEAIRLGIVKHLSSMQGLNLPNMEISVIQYSVVGNQATAQVQITAKGPQGATGAMQLNYGLEKTNSGWEVVKSAPAGGGMQHPTPGQAITTGALPPGHPGVNRNPGPVHPDFNEILKQGKAPTEQAPAQQQAPAPPPNGP